MDRYCALVKTYSEAVIELKDAHGNDLQQRRQHVDALRVVVEQARADWEDHEQKHGCFARAARQD